MDLMIIRDQHGRLDLLTNKETFPTEDWLAGQTIRPLSAGRWHTAYPLTGGAVSVQEGTYSVVREATTDDILELVDGRKHGFNPAARSVVEMLLKR